MNDNQVGDLERFLKEASSIEAMIENKELDKTSVEQALMLFHISWALGLKRQIGQ